jgi:phospholipid/cholesterol/gamma-HCH transport system substrate-binding protein
MSTHPTKEFLVGCLVLAAVILMFVFGWLMGLFRPFTGTAEYRIRYSFAGGVEVGSPVRVSGVKVGRVENIEFLPLADSNETVELVITVARRALPAVRSDSKFFINMAGIIGERYVEISPGTGELLVPGSKVRGVDPPRIDQLLSQGYGVFGRVQEFLEENEQTLSEFLKQMRAFMKDANQYLGSDKNRKKFFSLLENLEAVSGDVRSVSGGLRNPETQKLLEQLGVLIRRAHEVDEKALRKFMQEEGIRARIF